MERQEVIYYRQQLKEYLRSTKYYRNADEQKVQKFVEAIENDLLEVIRTNQHVDLQDVYEFIDKEALGELINLTNRGRSLCADNDADIAWYSSLNGNDHLFQAKYMLYMPTKEQLKLEIERENELYRLQHNEELKVIENGRNKWPSSATSASSPQASPQKGEGIRRCM